MYNGNQSIDGIYVGDQQVNTIYVGTEQVYNSSPPIVLTPNFEVFSVPAGSYVYYTSPVSGSYSDFANGSGFVEVQTWQDSDMWACFGLKPTSSSTKTLDDIKYITFKAEITQGQVKSNSSMHFKRYDGGLYNGNTALIKDSITNIVTPQSAMVCGGSGVQYIIVPANGDYCSQDSASTVGRLTIKLSNLDIQDSSHNSILNQ